MSWGTPTETASAPKAAIVYCEAPSCQSQAFLRILTPFGEPANACCEHAADCTISGTVEGAPFNEAARDMLLRVWEASKVTLEKAKATEMDLRKIVAGYVFTNPKEGVNNHELSGGAVLKMGHKLNYSLRGDNDAIEAVEDACEKFGNEGKFLIERIIVWKADFSKSEFNKLDPSLKLHADVKKQVETILEIKPGSPTLEIKEPKAKLNG